VEPARRCGPRLPGRRLARALLGPAWPHELRPAATHRGGDPVRVESVVAAPQLLRAVVDVLVGDTDHLELHPGAPFGEELAHRGPEAAGDDVFFHRDE